MKRQFQSTSKRPRIRRLHSCYFVPGTALLKRKLHIKHAIQNESSLSALFVKRYKKILKLFQQICASKIPFGAYHYLILHDAQALAHTSLVEKNLSPTSIHSS